MLRNLVTPAAFGLVKGLIGAGLASQATDVIAGPKFFPACGNYLASTWSPPTAVLAAPVDARIEGEPYLSKPATREQLIKALKKFGSVPQPIDLIAFYAQSPECPTPRSDTLCGLRDVMAQRTAVGRAALPTSSVREGRSTNLRSRRESSVFQGRCEEARLTLRG